MWTGYKSLNFLRFKGQMGAQKERLEFTVFPKIADQTERERFGDRTSMRNRISKN